MLKRRAFFGVAAAAAIALLPIAPAMANGHGFRALHPFGLGHGLLGAAVALATLPLVVASSVVAGVSESVAPDPAPGYTAPAYGYAPPVAYARPYYAPPVAYARPYYAPYPQYYAAPRAVPRGAYGPRGYYAAHTGYTGRGYYRAGGYSYPRR
jgi:hypothetical protein